MFIMGMMEDIDYYNGDYSEDELPGEIWCEMVYEEAEAYCALNNIDRDKITHDELEQCAVSTAAALDFTEGDVLIQLEHYWNCFE